MLLSEHFSQSQFSSGPYSPQRTLPWPHKAGEFGLCFRPPGKTEARHSEGSQSPTSGAGAEGETQHPEGCPRSRAAREAPGLSRQTCQEHLVIKLYTAYPEKRRSCASF